MKKLILFCSFILIYNSIVYAQKDFRYWKEGQLCLDDFQAKPKNNLSSSLNYYLGYKRHKIYTKDTTFILIKAYSYMRKKSSWINKNYEVDKNLQFNQIIFDLLELQNRQFQAKLYSLDSYTDYNLELNKHSKLLERKVEQFKTESNNGQNYDVIKKWNKNINKEINKNNIIRIPKYTKSNWGYSLNLGLGLSTYTNSLSKYFDNAIKFECGFDVSYKKSNIFINCSIEKNNLKETYANKQIWKNNSNVKIYCTNFKYGYNIINNAKFKIIPTAGLQYHQIVNGDKDNLIKMNSLGFIIGLNTDFKFKTIVNLYSNLHDHNKITEFSVRTKLYLANMYFDSNLKGCSINFAICINMFQTWIK